jgi:hypothetical protein
VLQAPAREPDPSGAGKILRAQDQEVHGRPGPGTRVLRAVAGMELLSQP